MPGGTISSVELLRARNMGYRQRNINEPVIFADGVRGGPTRCATRCPGTTDGHQQSSTVRQEVLANKLTANLEPVTQWWRHRCPIQMHRHHLDHRRDYRSTGK